MCFEWCFCFRIGGTHPSNPRQKLGTQKLWITLVIMAIAPLLDAMPAQAQALQTYVSGLGRDNWSCTMARPCRTFQAALARTAAGGEITALSSANYGSVTINK